MRDETEWVELVNSGHNFLAGSDFQNITSLYNQLADKGNIKVKDPLYGKGNAGMIVVDTLHINLI